MTPSIFSGLCRNYLKKKVAAGIFYVMAWPAQSSDLNSIELVWEKLDQRVWEHCPTSAAGLWGALQKAWEEVTHEYPVECPTFIRKLLLQRVFYCINCLLFFCRLLKTILLKSIKLNIGIHQRVFPNLFLPLYIEGFRACMKAAYE